MKLSLVLLALPLAAVACFGGGEVQQTRYFIPNAGLAQVESPIPASLEIPLFTVAPHLEGQNLAARTSSVELDYYVYHRWAGSLDRLLTQEARRFFRPAFRSVVDEATAQAADFQLICQVEAFEEIDEPEFWSASVQIHFTLKNLKTGNIAWTGFYESRLRCETRTPSAVVETLSKAYGEILQRAHDQMQTLWSSGKK